ncbi:hypothetical protein [Pacificispira sp.]|uniref:hypothetical protein n=1 Tax=Pacificispira sp. TaxID=2888761 RepID=UPI002EA31F4E|nr:hypothetical protein [Pseudomonadota bacterium]
MWIQLSLTDPLSAVPRLFDLMRRMEIGIAEFSMRARPDDSFIAEVHLGAAPADRTANLVDRLGQLPIIVLLSGPDGENETEATNLRTGTR